VSWLLWLVPVCMTAHNVEEAIGADQFLADVHALLPRAMVRPRLFLAALLLLIVATWVIALLAIRDPSSVWPGALVGIQLVLAANAVVPHLMLLVRLRRYSPGLITAAALNLPVGVYLLFAMTTGRI